MKPTHFLIQASSRSWSGGRDLCMASVNGRPAVHWTVERVFSRCRDARVTIVAPELDRGGELDQVRQAFPTVEIFYGHDASPLDRMLAVCADHDDDDHFVRVDGLHL